MPSRLNDDVFGGFSFARNGQGRGGMAGCYRALSTESVGVCTVIHIEKATPIYKIDRSHIQI